MKETRHLAKDVSLTFRGFPPVGVHHVNLIVPLSLLDMNAMRLPSRDHEGVQSSAECLVKLRGLRPLTSIT